MKTPIEYWIWMQSALGAGANVAAMLNYYKTPEGIYNALGYGRADSVIMPATRRRLASVSPSQSYSTLKRCEDNGWKIITPDSEFYPDEFRVLENMPLALYVSGDESLLLSQPAVAFVGTRMASAYGRKIAEKLSFAVAAAGMTVVSGCALGIDSCSHMGALEANGKTVGFLGSSLDSDYPRGNSNLRRAISEKGAVVTEYAPGCAIKKSNFPIRNRLIAALSLGTVVIEADTKSGALITANCAADLGKDVFAVPGEILDSSFSGGNRLIRDGAKPVFTAMDILEEYAYDYETVIDISKADTPFMSADNSKIYTEETPAKKKSDKKINLPKRSVAAENTCDTISLFELENTKSPTDAAFCADGLSELGKKIYSYIASNGEAEADEIAAGLGLPISEALSELTALELFGAVSRGSGGKYSQTASRRITAESDGCFN